MPFSTRLLIKYYRQFFFYLSGNDCLVMGDKSIEKEKHNTSHTDKCHGTACKIVFGCDWRHWSRKCDCLHKNHEQK